jgi:hypothetical protein
MVKMSLPLPPPRKEFQNDKWTQMSLSLSSPRDGILGHQFDKKIESFAPCYSHSLLRRKNEGGKLEPEKTRVYAQKPQLKMPFKNSISGKTQQFMRRLPKMVVCPSL